MPRATNSVASRRRKKRVYKKAKGYFGRRKNVWTVTKNAVERAMQYSYVGRKLKKRDFRKLWIQRINAAVREEGMSYSEFIGKLSSRNIALNRKVLADLAMNHPETFKEICKEVKGTPKKAEAEKVEAPATKAKKEEVKEEEPQPQKEDAKAKKEEPKKEDAKAEEKEASVKKEEPKVEEKDSKVQIEEKPATKNV